MLSICTEFLFDCRQKVVVDGSASEWILREGSVLRPLLFIIYASEIFELVENRLFADADDSPLLAVVRKPADRPAVLPPITRTWQGFRSGAITGA